MGDEVKAREFISKFFDSHSKSFFKRMEERGKGLHVIMHLLDRCGDAVVAGYIAEELNMSTPRVAAALKALESKGYIVRSQSDDDRRKTVVAITEAGRAAVKRDEVALVELITYLYDTVGEADINEFLRIIVKINNAIDNRIE